MKPLSERLQWMYDNDYMDWDVVSDAIQLAKRYEDAPVGELFVSHHDARDFAIADDGNSINLRYLAGQRVRIVLDKEG